MKYKEFKTHEVKRGNPKKYRQYKSYRSQLEQDFRHRCCYCNYSDKRSMVSFEIDHFIPKEAFKNVNDILMTKYENLMYSCKKCNGAKSDQFEGDVFSPVCSNDLFYDPTRIDYNIIFYRDENGAIASDDAKGLDMISRLRLYRPIHILAWLCEELEMKKDKLKEKYEHEENPDIKQRLCKAYNIMLEYYSEFRDIFDASYREEKFELNPVKKMVDMLLTEDT